MEGSHDWDLLIPYALFAIRETPQASLGFTPFKLLFGQRQRGLLNMGEAANR